jgi:phenylalanyl-tRNA synthetase alpha chain
MQEKFNLLKQNAKNELEGLTSTKNLGELRAKYIGKSGEVTALLRGMKDVPADQRAEFGKMVNELKEEIAGYFAEKEEKLKAEELNRKFQAEAIDVTLPAEKQPSGSIHPLNIVKNKILNAFCFIKPSKRVKGCPLYIF